MTREPRGRHSSPEHRSGKGPRAGKDVSGVEPLNIVHGVLPPRDVILRFIADHPQQASKRELAKAFGLKGDERIALKHLLRDLEEEGMLQKSRKSLIRPGALPPITVLDITTRDKDGELIGRPAEWPEDAGVAPAVAIRQSSSPAGRNGKGKAPVAGMGDRVLAKIFAASDRGGPAYTARIIKVLDKRRGAALGVFRETPGGGGRLMPIERRGEEMVIDPDDTGDAKDGDLVEVGSGSPRPLRPAARQGTVGRRFRGFGKGDLDDRHLRARHPAYLPASRHRRGGCRQAGNDVASRGLARPAAGHHRPGRRQGS